MTMNQISAVLFDLDGVVVLTDQYHYQAWQRLADEEGWSFDETVNHRLRGVSRIDSLQSILDHNGVTKTDEEKMLLADRKNRYYVEGLQYISSGACYPGAEKFIRELRVHGAKIALCSASRNATFVLEKLGLSSLFDVVVTGADVTRSKPDPEIFLMAADRLRLPPAHCLVFEDAESGVQAAQAARMGCIGVGPADRLPNAEETIIDYAAIDIPRLLSTGRVSDAAPPLAQR